MPNPDTFHIDFGALAPPLRVQLEEQGITAGSKEVLAFLQRDADDLTRMVIRGYMSQDLVNKGRKKLMDLLVKEVRDAREND